MDSSLTRLVRDRLSYPRKTRTARNKNETNWKDLWDFLSNLFGKTPPIGKTAEMMDGSVLGSGGGFA